MKAASYIGLAASAALGLVLAAPALAQDPSGGREVPYEESARSFGTGDGPKAGARSMEREPIQRSAPRDVTLDPETARSAYKLVGRTMSGEDVEREPSEDVLRAIMGEAAPDDQRGSIEGDTTDPDFAEADGEEERAVIGADNRIHVSNTRTYPFTTIGYLEAYWDQETWWNCSAVMVGPRIALTAASCLYQHEDGGWAEEVAFWPAVNGEDDVPFGGFMAQTIYVFNAFIGNYDGSYDAVWPYDVGIIEFGENVGDYTGWMAYWNYENLGDFQANLVGYQNDKQPFTMWRSNCNVMAENVGAYDILHDCDGDWGTFGAPVYLFDRAANLRVIVGVNQGGDETTNWALRIHDAVFAWLNDLNQ